MNTNLTLNALEIAATAAAGALLGSTVGPMEAVKDAAMAVGGYVIMKGLYKLASSCSSPAQQADVNAPAQRRRVGV